jgi:hypothetical protein
VNLPILPTFALSDVQFYFLFFDFRELEIGVFVINSSSLKAMAAAFE